MAVDGETMDNSWKLMESAEFTMEITIEAWISDSDPGTNSCALLAVFP